jgi:putative chitinase
MIDVTTLVRVFGIPTSTAVAWLPHIRAALQLADCTTPQRTAAWLAQVGHESGRLRYVREIWGPTKQQLRYELGTPLAARLGNVQEGDGYRYMGRGLLQITGRANYCNARDKLSEFMSDVPDFEATPEALQYRLWAALTASLYWKTRNLNRYVDSGNFSELTRRINGGYNGLADRQALYARALFVV